MGAAAADRIGAAVSRTAVASVLLGMIVVFLDTTVVAVALPSIADDLHASDGIDAVVTVYLLAFGVTQLPAGWLADRFGARRVFLGGVAAFLSFSMLAAMAPTLGALVAVRAAQGVAGGLVFPLGTAMLFSLYPPERRGAAVGLSGTVVMAAPALGPLLSGFVVSWASWRFLLLLNIPLSLGCLAAGLRRLPDISDRRRRRFDVVSLLLAGGGLVAVLVACSEADGWGVTSARFVACTGLGVGLILAFVFRGLRVREPLVDLSMYRSRTFSVTMGIVCLVAMAQFARAVFIPLELQAVHGVTPLAAGAVLTPGAVLAAIAMPIAGRWADRRGARQVMLASLLVLLVSTLLLARLHTESPLSYVTALVTASGVAVSLVAMASTVDGLSSVPGHLVPQAAAMRSLTRQVAGALATAVLAAFIGARSGGLAAVRTPAAVAEAQDAYNRGFLLAGLVVLGAVALAVAGPRDQKEMT